MTELLTYLQQAVDRHASDLFLVAGGPASIKVDRQLIHLEEERLMPKDTRRLINELYQMANRSSEGFTLCGDDDFSFALPGLSRFRVSVYRQRGSTAAVIRVVAFNIPDYQALSIPEGIMDLSQLKDGMVLVTGTAGSGKSTTLACIIDRINHTRELHVVTLEDPIEYLHRNHRSIISQREIVTDTGDYLSALRSCLRQAPDVIQLGEMRDRDTISTAITAAETGHFLLATLHTKGAVNAVDRILDSFPSEQQKQVRFQLAMVLHTVVSQQLLPATDGGVIPAFEILRMNEATRNLIRDSKTHQLDSAMAAGGAEGMMTMDQSILELYRQGKITREIALQYAENVEQMRRKIG